MDENTQQADQGGQLDSRAIGDEQTKRDAAARSATADTSNKCPNCGGDFMDVKRRPIDKESRQAAAIKDDRAAIDEERGVLQECVRCGYQRRAKDKIEAGKRK